MSKSKETKEKNPLLGEDEGVKEEGAKVPEAEGAKAPVAKPKVDAGAQLLSDIQLTKKNLEAEAQVMFMVPLAVGEKAGAVHDCYVNGYHYPVKKGVMTKVPESIAIMLGIHYQIESEAGSGFRIDNDPAKQNALG
jgi:hypothetical protein